MALLQQGLVDMGFIGGAEVDRYGNLNTSYIGDWRAPAVKLPGSGGGADIASLARRVVIIMPHALAGGGPAALITTLGVFRFDAETREAALASYHPGQSVDSVRAATGWPLRVAGDVRETVPPTQEELGFVRACDPEGFWTR